MNLDSYEQNKNNRTTLQVICLGCSHSGVLNHRYLAKRFGMAKQLTEIEFVCHQCQARRYRLKFVSDHLGETKPLTMQWFGGAYEKFLD